MMKLPRVLDLRNRHSCNIVVPNRRPLFPFFLAPGALNGANTVLIVSYFSMKTYVMVPIRSALVMGTHNICFHREIRKILPEYAHYLELCPLHLLQFIYKVCLYLENMPAGTGSGRTRTNGRFAAKL